MQNTTLEGLHNDRLLLLQENKILKEQLSGLLDKLSAIVNEHEHALNDSNNNNDNMRNSWTRPVRLWTPNRVKQRVNTCACSPL